MQRTCTRTHAHTHTRTHAHTHKHNMPPTPIEIDAYVRQFEASQRTRGADERTLAAACAVLRERAVGATEEVRRSADGRDITDRTIRMADAPSIRSFVKAMEYAREHMDGDPGAGPGSLTRHGARADTAPLMMLVDAANASGPSGPSGLSGQMALSVRPARVRGGEGGGRGGRRAADGGDGPKPGRAELEALLPRIERLERLQRQDRKRIEAAEMLASEAMKQAVDGEKRTVDACICSCTQGASPLGPPPRGRAP